MHHLKMTDKKPRAFNVTHHARSKLSLLSSAAIPPFLPVTKLNVRVPARVSRGHFTINWVPLWDRLDAMKRKKKRMGFLEPMEHLWIPSHPIVTPSSPLPSSLPSRPCMPVTPVKSRVRQM